MEPKNKCDKCLTCLYRDAPCDIGFCPHWKPNPNHWKQKFQDKTRGGYEWEIYEEFKGRLYGRLRINTGWIGASWDAKGSFFKSSECEYDLLPREPDIYDTPEWEKYKKVMGIEELTQSDKFKKLYNAGFRLMEGNYV